MKIVERWSTGQPRAVVATLILFLSGPSFLSASRKLIGLCTPAAAIEATGLLPNEPKPSPQFFPTQFSRGHPLKLRNQFSLRTTPFLPWLLAGWDTSVP